MPVKVRTRGNFRRSKANCNFPPLRLNFAGKSVEGTVFEGQDKLKLVSPVPGLQRHLSAVRAPGVPRLPALPAPHARRASACASLARHVRGRERRYDTRTKMAFFIEDDEAMAARNGGELWDGAVQSHDSTDARAAVRVLARRIRRGRGDVALRVHDRQHRFLGALPPQRRHDPEPGDGHYVWVPYDFDWSGVVNARYATPDPKLDVRNVRDRVFRGFCRPGSTSAIAVIGFKATGTPSLPLYQWMPGPRGRTSGSTR